MPAEFYSGFNYFAQYGPLYQRIVACYRGRDEQGRDEFLAVIRGHDSDLPECVYLNSSIRTSHEQSSSIDDYHFHPAVIDAALHAAVHPMMTGYKVGPQYYLPSKCRTVTVARASAGKPFPKTVISHGTMMVYSPGMFYLFL